MRNYLLIAVMLWICGCKNEIGFTKINPGLEYKLVQRDAGGISVQPGQYLKLSVTQNYGDTVLVDPLRMGPQYQVVDTAQMTEEAWVIFHEACIGDSIVFRVPSDSAFKNKKPAFVKNKDWLVTKIKVLSILANADSVYADRERDRERLNPYQ